MGRKKTNFWESAILNDQTYNHFLLRLIEISVSMFEWKGLPDSVDERYLEMQLFQSGSAVYFRDDVLERDLCLSCLPSGKLDVYGVPVTRRAYSIYNNYSYDLTEDNSVIIWNNFMRINSVDTATMFARKLYLIDRTIDVNMHAQRTPVLVQGSEKQRLSLLNLYKEYQGNSPVIFGDKSLDITALKVLKTDAPYVIDKLQEHKEAVWNEALTYLGIANLRVQKKERLITDEVNRSQGGTIASGYSRLAVREMAAEKINRMFGTNISVGYREGLDISIRDGYTINDTFENGGGDLLE